ncbi:MAG: hypothetical protein LBS50_11135 [Prevotellaceae bacterium]|jgi:hypothetical protein|nr:hypothetical protein [Prevotellaceae bacterium]
MKKFVFILLLLFYACSVTTQQSSITGQFKGRTPSMGSFVPQDEMELFLNVDSSFNIHWLGVDYTGRWKVLGKNQLKLKFDEITDVYVHLRSGVILDRERTVKFIDKNKLKFGNTILKRKL